MPAAYSKVDDALLAYVLLTYYLQHEGRSSDMADLRAVVGTRGQLGGVTAACFLLYRPSDKGDVSVHDFLFETVPILLQQLSRTTQRERVVMTGHTRGRVDWSSTYKARYSSDANPSVFVCLQSSRLFDRPENQFLKFLLQRIRDCLERVPFYLREWQAWGPTLQAMNNGMPLHVGSYLATLAHHVRTYSSHVSLREVELPLSIESKHMLAARTSKNELYVSVADLFDLYRTVIDIPDCSQWVKVVRQTLPLPPNIGELGRVLVV